MTWAGVFLAVFGLAVITTLLYAVVEEGIVFSAAVASASWFMIAFMPEVVRVSGGEEVLVQIGPSRWLFAGLGILSALVLLFAVLGWYPMEEHEDSRQGMIQ